MGKLEKIVEKDKILIDVIGTCLCQASIICNVIFMNHEYNRNIGTLYKGSIKESNKLLRFKERFKSIYLATIIGIQGKCVEVI